MDGVPLLFLRTGIAARWLGPLPQSNHDFKAEESASMALLRQALS
jgi:hypothetical protein